MSRMSLADKADRLRQDFNAPGKPIPKLIEQVAREVGIGQKELANKSLQEQVDACCTRVYGPGGPNTLLHQMDEPNPEYPLVQAVVVSEQKPTIRTTEFIGGHTGVSHKRAGSAKPKLVEFPTDAELQAMTRGELMELTFTEVSWLARGGLDALQFTRNGGIQSPFWGACPSLNGSAPRFGDVRGQAKRAMLSSNIRAIDVFFYKHDVTGLAFIGEGGRVIAQEGPGSCRDLFGQKRVQLAQNEKLVGFKLYTDHCTPMIAFKIADMGTPQTAEAAPPQQQSMVATQQHAPGHITTREIEGCWCCVCIPGGTACFHKKAAGEDKLIHSGVVFLCFALPLPFVEPRIRHPGTNGFYKEGEPGNVDYYPSAHFVSNGLSCSWKWF